MTKKLIFLSGVFTVTVFYFWPRVNILKFSEVIDQSSTQNRNPIHQIDINNLQIDGRKVVGLLPGRERDQLRNMKVLNSPSQSWEESLKTNLQQQAGNTLKEIKLKKIDSFVWVHEGIPLFVESVIVTLKGDENQIVNFKVLVDSESGKILKNWDQPVFDPMDPRTNFKIKVDPRYHLEN